MITLLLSSLVVFLVLMFLLCNFEKDPQDCIREYYDRDHYRD